jgi:hypothetical protein
MYRSFRIETAKLFLLISFLCIPIFISKAQTTSLTISEFSAPELKMKQLLDSLQKQQSDSAKELINNIVLDSLEKVLTQGNSFTYNFDSLKHIGKLLSPDKNFRILTWNIPQSDATNRYYGLIQMSPDKDNNCQIFRLKDKSSELKGDLTKRKLESSEWFGALYYEILPQKSKDQTFYTLLGVHYNDLYTNKKVIESLYFNDKGKPEFGLPVYRMGKQVFNRVVFEYSVYAVMMLRYHKPLKMIVFDHLSPSSPMYVGNYSYYGPDFSYDGLKFEKDKWVLYPNIDFKPEKK